MARFQLELSILVELIVGTSDNLFKRFTLPKIKYATFYRQVSKGIVIQKENECFPLPSGELTLSRASRSTTNHTSSYVDSFAV